RDDHRVHERLEVIVLRLHLGVALQRARRDQAEAGDRLRLRLEGGDDGVEDREEQKQRDCPCGHGPTDLRAGRDCACHRVVSYLSKFLPTARIRNSATTLARITAMMPPAEAPPTS